MRWCAVCLGETVECGHGCCPAWCLTCLDYAWDTIDDPEPHVTAEELGL